MVGIRSGIAIAAIGLLAGGCGTFTDGPQQAVYIDTVGVSSNCVVQSKSIGRVRADAPGQVSVRRSRHPLRISCFAEGYKPAGAVIQPSFETLSGGNRYPDRVRIVLTKQVDAPGVKDLEERKRSKIRTN